MDKTTEKKIKSIIAPVFHADYNDIHSIQPLKTGMTNHSYIFIFQNKKYILRIPGEGTDCLINRKEEAKVYNVIRDKGLCDNIIFFDPVNGYKITEFIEGAINCNPFDSDDIKKAMSFLRGFHSLKLQVDSFFDIFEQINYYESLWNGHSSEYQDYLETKENVFKLKSFIDKTAKNYTLTHIDSVPDNFIFAEEDNKSKTYLIDWEYAAMQDPDVDIAMFCIYSLYDKAHIDELIDTYYYEGCPKETRIKIYCYIASCGLLWSNWCEYKKILGVSFDEYAQKQYKYAKDYFKIVKDCIAL